MLLSRRWAYCVAVLAAAASLLTTEVTTLITHTPSLLAPSVAIALASLQGYGPGIVCLAVSIFGFVVKWIGPTIEQHEVYRIVFFCIEQGIFMYFAAQMRNALERAEAAEQETRKAYDLQERFVAMVNHDLRNPLNAIKMSIPLLRKDCSESQAKTLHRLENSAGRMHILVNDLLDFARSRHGGLRLEKVNTRLSDICERVLEGRSSRIRIKAFGYDGGLLDPARVAQVVDNLVANALQHGEDGPIDVIASGDPDCVKLEVRNKGMVDPAVMPYLFDPFRAGPNDTGSVGLGLYIVSQIAKAHGGAVAVRSEGGTTRFVVTFRKAGRGALPTLDEVRVRRG